MTLDDVKKVLDENTNLNDELRDNIYGLIHIFNQKYPAVDLTNLCNNLKTLEIKKSSKFINKRVSKYNYKTNILEFNVDKINEGYDMKHILMYELLNIISNNGEMTGFNLNDKFKALNAGYTEILANNLVGNDSEISHLEPEVISTNMIALMVGDDILFDAYFKNDPQIVTKALMEKGFE